ncbi:uncharacterized protein YuzB (UPF0349 family) [Anaerosolibacter carboniphilus]|uniref:Uncharacterized protein YuzB (UPF0349 family) n=1 Tax=Anaerosolibacter carboniphilus TaxID=1417629 RepID=A0A841KPW3_9FIRM|nr:hypothetical protein [Anaerosolibacter carboniphilus]MBB6215477.1 uncharacterized protein YuzB (UPF0349 family) [Anaerosolibacter carboniphilus]
MIKVCKFTDCHDELVRALEENNILFTDEECLQRCDLCHSCAFVKKDEEYIHADDVKELIEILKANN